jgi:hypothetical protein
MPRRPVRGRCDVAWERTFAGVSSTVIFVAEHAARFPAGARGPLRPAVIEWERLAFCTAAAGARQKVHRDVGHRRVPDPVAFPGSFERHRPAKGESAELGHHVHSPVRRRTFGVIPPVGCPSRQAPGSPDRWLPRSRPAPCSRPAPRLGPAGAARPDGGDPGRGWPPACEHHVRFRADGTVGTGLVTSARRDTRPTQPAGRPGGCRGAGRR